MFLAPLGGAHLPTFRSSSGDGIRVAVLPCESWVRFGAAAPSFLNRTACRARGVPRFRSTADKEHQHTGADCAHTIWRLNHGDEWRFLATNGGWDFKHIALCKSGRCAT